MKEIKIADNRKNKTKQITTKHNNLTPLDLHSQFLERKLVSAVLHGLNLKREMEKKKLQKR